MPDTPLSATPHRRTALVLAGGGARGAYEAGIVDYLEQELAPELGRKLPFDILCGTSIGALNACALAALADEPTRSTQILELWRSLNCDEVLSFGVFDALRLVRESLGLGAALTHRHDERRAGLVDTTGLQRLLLTRIPWRHISWNLRRGLLEALSVGATDVGTGQTTVFIQRRDETPLSRDSSFHSEPARISARHALASAAIPLIFPPVRIGNVLYADGGLRLNVPLSPALRLGAERIVVVSLRAETEKRAIVSPAARADAELAFPSAAFLIGKMLSAVFEESVEQDISRLVRMNAILEAGTAAYGAGFRKNVNQALAPGGHPSLRQVRTLLVRPSESIGMLAADFMRSEFHAHGGMAGRSLRAIADREGATEADLTSYLLFEGGFAAKLIELGRRDARARKNEWVRFWSEEPQTEWERAFSA